MKLSYNFKKSICSILAFAVVAGGASLAAYADGEPVLISANPSAEDFVEGTPQISVNGEKLDLEGSGLTQYLFEQNGNAMVPLRIIAEKMGYKVDWDNEKKAVTVGDDEWEAVFTIGEDSYYGVTKIKDAVGMTAPQSYGAAPVLVDNSTFVPAKMFEIMGYACNSIGQYVDFVKAGSDTVQIPNPLRDYKTVEEAKKAVSFDAKIPSKLPDGFKITYVGTISDEILQVFYGSGDKKIVYRTALGEGEISGDYNVYKTEKTIKAKSGDVTFKKGENGALALWNDGKCTYSASFNYDAAESDVLSIINSLS